MRIIDFVDLLFFEYCSIQIRKKFSLNKGRGKSNELDSVSYGVKHISNDSEFSTERNCD